MANTALTPVAFHGDTLYAVTIDGAHYVALKPICDALGLAWSGQFERVQRHPVLAEGVRVTRMQMPSDDQAREVVCIPLNMLNGWLFGVSAARVKPELRERIVAYQRECFEVLARHFMPKAVPQPTPTTGLHLDDGDAVNLLSLFAAVAVVHKAWEGQLRPALRLLDAPMLPRLCDQLATIRMVCQLIERHHRAELAASNRRVRAEIDAEVREARGRRLSAELQQRLC